MTAVLVAPVTISFGGRSSKATISSRTLLELEAPSTPPDGWFDGAAESEDDDGALSDEEEDQGGDSDE